MRPPVGNAGTRSRSRRSPSRATDGTSRGSYWRPTTAGPSPHTTLHTPQCRLQVRAGDRTRDGAARVESRFVTPPRGSAQPPEFAVFHVDASTWIGLHEENYPPDVFPSLWTALSDHAQHGRIKSPHEVMREVGEDQGVGAWLRMQQPSIVPRATPPVQRLVTPTSRR